MNITHLHLSNIKGISNLDLKMNLFPNKPTIFVAPNGFGKSSLAHGFECIHPRKLILQEEYYYNKDKNNFPEIKISIDNTEYVIDGNHRTFPGNWDIQVYNSKLKPESIKKNFGKFTQVTTFMAIETITVLEQIPQNISLPYNFSKMKCTFGNNNKILLNISAQLSTWILYIDSKFIQSEKISLFTAKATQLKNAINAEYGSSNEIKSKYQLLIQNDKELMKIILPFMNYFSLQEVDTLFTLWQIYLLSTEPDYLHSKKYHQYLRSKEQLDSMLYEFDTTGKEIKSKEIKTGSTKALVVEFPRALDISNGQRDVLVFITELFKTQVNAKKENLILIIDEIFDYLDAGNLIAFQYYIVKMIDSYLSMGRNIFPILLTHLDPSTFNHFYFNKKKLQIVYLKHNCISSVNKYCSKLAEYRNDLEKINKTLKEDIEGHFFHFHNQNYTSPSEIININQKWIDSFSFYNYVYNEELKYFNNNTYEYLAILFATRIKIEELCFKVLKPSEQPDFLTTHKTVNKIEYCTSLGYEIPDYYSLLGILYNDYLHWKPSINYDSPLMIKLEHPIIRKMILELFNQS